MLKAVFGSMPACLQRRRPCITRVFLHFVRACFRTATCSICFSGSPAVPTMMSIDSLGYSKSLLRMVRRDVSHELVQLLCNLARHKEKLPSLSSSLGGGTRCLVAARHSPCSFEAFRSFKRASCGFPNALLGLLSFVALQLIWAWFVVNVGRSSF